LPVVIGLDFILLAAGLVVFALFHHVLPRDTGTTGLILPRSSQTTAAMAPDTAAPDQEVTHSVSESATTGQYDQEKTLASTVPTTISPDNWLAKFADHFTSGAIIQTEHAYQSAWISVTIEQRTLGDATYYLADLYLSDISQLCTALAGDRYARGLTDDVLDLAQANNAILAITGDYYGIRDQGIVIRNGILYRDVTYRDVCILYFDGTMETVTAKDFDRDRILAEGAWQAWSFGPMLLDQGEAMTRFNSDVSQDNPRSAIGYYEPGHYCFVLVDGRQPGYSNGMSLTELSGLFHDLGCTAAYNLDGGQSAVLTYLDHVVNQPYKDGRQISDIVYIADLAPP
jgi:exopolysaccharide biosynthesis protein